MNCPECKKDIRTAFSRPLEFCAGCCPIETVKLGSVCDMGAGAFVSWCVRQVEARVSKCPLKIVPDRRWSVTSMSDNAWKNWLRAELRSAARVPKTKTVIEKRPLQIVKPAPDRIPLGAFDPSAFALVVTARAL